MIKAGNFLGAVLLLVFVLIGCGQDDLKNVGSISTKKVALSKDRSYGVRVVYSDSAVVKAIGFAPVYDKVKPAQGTQYNEMPKGVKIEFYDAFMRVKGTITSDYAINNETDKITTFRKNVVVVSDEMTFKTEELIWNENTRMYTSPYGTVTTKSGDIVTGSQFSAPQDFSTYTITQGTAQGYVKGDMGI